jgi:hypothetical protein
VILIGIQYQRVDHIELSEVGDRGVALRNVVMNSKIPEMQFID